MTNIINIINNITQIISGVNTWITGSVYIWFLFVPHPLPLSSLFVGHIREFMAGEGDEGGKRVTLRNQMNIVLDYIHSAVKDIKLVKRVIYK